MAESIMLEPGEGHGLDLTVNDGENILVIKRLKNGRIEIPMITCAKVLPDKELRAEIVSMCHAVINHLERN